MLPGIPSLAILFAALFTSLKDAKFTERLRDIGAVAVTAIAILCVATCLDVGLRSTHHRID